MGRQSPDNGPDRKRETDHDCIGRFGRCWSVRGPGHHTAVLRLPDFDRADRIGEFWGHPETRTFGELLIDVEEDKAARAVVFGLLREMELK